MNQQPDHDLRDPYRETPEDPATRDRGYLGLSEWLNGYIRQRPMINAVYIEKGIHHLKTSQDLEIDGLFVLRVSTRRFQLQPNGDLTYLDQDVIDLFYRHYPGKGWREVGEGRDGQILKRTADPEYLRCG